MTEKERIIHLENEVAKLKSVLDDALEVGRLTQLAYNKLLYASNARIPTYINIELTKMWERNTVLSRRINQYIDKQNSGITKCA
jgi:hypothetical protein